MGYFFKNAAFAALLVGATLVLSGCQSDLKIKMADPADGYTTDYALSAVEYNIYLNKQIGVAENIISTRMSMADTVNTGNYDPAKELEHVEESLSKLQTLIDDVTTTMPAVSYESDRERILSILSDAQSALNEYKNALSSGDVSDSIAQLKGCYIALSGEANSYYN